MIEAVLLNLYARRRELERAKQAYKRALEAVEKARIADEEAMKRITARKAQQPVA